MTSEDLLTQFRKKIKEEANTPDYPSVNQFLKVCRKLDLPIFLIYEDTTKNLNPRLGYVFNNNPNAFYNFLENQLPASVFGNGMRKNEDIPNGNFRFYYLSEFEIIFFQVKWMQDCFFIRSKRIMR